MLETHGCVPDCYGGCCTQRYDQQDLPDALREPTR
jgi:hypothetical protein